MRDFGLKGIIILKNSIRDAFKSLTRNLSLSFACFFCMAITLSMFAIAIIIILNVQYVILNLEKEIDITVYLDSNISVEKRDDILKEIKNISNIESYTFVSKDTWKNLVVEESAFFEDTLEILEENPLLDSFDICLKDLKLLDDTVLELEKIDGIVKIDYGQEFMANILYVIDAVKRFIFIIAFILLMATFLLIYNTIRLAIFARRDEIEIMRFVGSSNLAIRLPFIFEGMIVGFFSSLIPIIIIMYFYLLFQEKISNYQFLQIFSFIPPMPFLLYLAFVLVFMGIFLGSISSYWAVRRYLKI